MTLQEGLLFSALAFIGTHFLLSHVLRAPLVQAVGARAFHGIYSLVALVTFGLMSTSTAPSAANHRYRRRATPCG